MSDEQSQTNEGTDTPDERTMLMQRARMMGLTISNNIGIDTLRQRIADAMAGNKGNDEKVDQLDGPAPMRDPSLPKADTPQTLRQKILAENMRLIRVRITNLDPKKKDLPGEVITVANGYLGTVRKYIPFGEVTENGYHIPYVLYKMLKNRKFLNIRTRKDRNNGNNIIVEQNWVPEFALEVLDPLTKEELAKLAAAQSAAGGVG